MLWKICLFTLILASFALPAIARTPNDTDYSEQWYLEKIGAPAAWDVATGTHDVVVAVLDSGVDLDHPDLVANFWSNPGEIAGNGVDDDGNGYVDDNRGWDFVEEDNTPEPTRGGAYTDDGVAHGTVIAGLIGAVGNNGQGISGVSWRVSIMSLRVLDDVGSGDSADARRAIEYAIENGANVINLSFTGYEVDQAFEQAVNEAYVAGIPVIAAVGNVNGGGINVDETPVYPACFVGERADWVIGVAATTKEDTKTDFSNYGSTCTELSAPGEDLFGTMYQNDDWADFPDYYHGGWSGTSVAAPLVTGAVALLKSAFPSLTPSLMRTVLQLSVDPLKESGTDATGKLGAGRLNVGRAMEIAPAFAGMAAGGALPGSMGISPITGEQEEITSITPGAFIRSPGFDTVYYVDGGYNRHPLWDQQTFFTWNDSWDDVVWVTDATLPTLPLGNVLPPKPGVVLVKIQSDARAYVVENGATLWRPILRELTSEDVAAGMFGANWGDFVIDVEPTLFSHYQAGDPIVSVEPADLSALKTRLSLLSN